MFDPGDLEAAIEELDARYLAGEASAHSHTWSVITGGNAALNRRELPPATPDCVSIDHRRGASFAPGELVAYLDAGIDLGQSIRTYIEVVHRLSDLGAVYTHAGHGVSQEGFDAEWRGIDLVTIEGDMVNRCEVFDEEDVDAALTRFDELHAQAPRLENAASQVVERFRAHFAVRDWDAMSQAMADNYDSDDRRCVVGAGVRHGRDAAIENYRAVADVGFTSISATVIGTRGERVVLSRLRIHSSSRDELPEPFRMELLGVMEINASNRIAAVVVFDPDDFEAAYEELDARYLAGEAAAHAHTWSVIAEAYAALNRRELPQTTPDWVNIDHRRGASIAPGEMPELLGAAWNLPSDLSNFIVATHRLNDLGGVFTHMAHETSQEGFYAEWRVVSVLTLKGDMVNRAEVFDEGDLNAALARFDELSRPVPQLENAATRADGRFMNCFAARDWDAMAEILADDFSIDDRRRVVNIGIRRGRDVEIANMRAAAEIGAKAFTFVVIATRGKR